jgi:hypothetical protein
MDKQNLRVGERLRQIEGGGWRILTITRLPRYTDDPPRYAGYIGAAKKQTVELTEGDLSKWHLFE